MAPLKINIQPVRACEKRRHYTIEEAELYRYSLAHVERLLCPWCPPLTVFHCPQCNAYHVRHSN